MGYAEVHVSYYIPPKSIGNSKGQYVSATCERVQLSI